MGRVKDYAMDEAERLVYETYKKVSEGTITYDDTQRIYADDLTSEQIEILKFIGITDEIEFREAIENA
jgi:hypothetical protein